MFNFTLYKKEFIGSVKTLTILSIVLVFYILMVLSMYTPEIDNLLDGFTKAMPEVMNMLGMKPGESTLIGFVSSYLYGFIMIAFPMIFSIFCANSIIAKHVERGSMTYMLSAPVKRKTVAFTQMKVLVTGIFIMILLATAVTGIASEVMFPGKIDVKGFIFINIGLLFLQLFIGSICFLCSCIFNESKLSLSFGAGIVALAFILKMLSEVGDKFDGIKYFTFFTLYNPDKIIQGSEGAYLGSVALLAGGIVLFVMSIIIFKRKNLNI